MFAWYYQSEICYAYLSDIPSTSPTSSTQHLFRSFRQSKWFTRGWTLQELLAPRSIEFLDRNWVELGTRSSLASIIESATGISDLFNWKEACIAQKMSWAARRVTTRIEDEAYCLMGIFNVNMPLLYGEGRKAFVRLQLEILAKSDDESIFAWSHDDGKGDSMTGMGLLATSPKFFKYSGSIQRGNFDISRPSYAMTNKGLRLELQLLPNYKQKDFVRTPPEQLTPLNCTVPRDPSPNAPRRTVALRLIRKGDKYSRQPQLETHDLVGQEIHLKQNHRTVVFVEQENIEPSVPYQNQGDIQIYFALNNIKEFGFSATRPFFQPLEAELFAVITQVEENIVSVRTIHYYLPDYILSFVGISFRRDTLVGPIVFTILMGASPTRTWVEVLKQHMSDVLARELAWPLSDADPKAHQDRLSIDLGEGFMLTVLLKKKAIRQGEARNEIGYVVSASLSRTAREGQGEEKVRKRKGN